jgi:predicted Rossmann-fold nucleotide-binding protein
MHSPLPIFAKTKKTMNDIKNICVYSASSTKIDSIYFEAAEELGKILAQKHINLINGAGCPAGEKDSPNS